MAHRVASTHTEQHVLKINTDVHPRPEWDYSYYPSVRTIGNSMLLRPRIHRDRLNPVYGLIQNKFEITFSLVRPFPTLQEPPADFAMTDCAHIICA
jgi:hypothetical protein